jgi:hypothetical protein
LKKKVFTDKITFILEYRRHEKNFHVTSDFHAKYLKLALKSDMGKNFFDPLMLPKNFRLMHMLTLFGKGMFLSRLILKFVIE